jgi:hypothetical protein
VAVAKSEQHLRTFSRAYEDLLRFRATLPWRSFCIVPVAMVERFQELAAWQLSVELCEVVFEITEGGKAAADTEFRNQDQKRCEVGAIADR